MVNEQRNLVRDAFARIERLWNEGGPVAVPRHIAVHPTEQGEFPRARYASRGADAYLWENDYGAFVIEPDVTVERGTFRLYKPR